MKGLKKRHNLCLLCVDVQGRRPLRSRVRAGFPPEQLVSAAADGSAGGPASLPPPRCLPDFEAALRVGTLPGRG